jgi:hypothetical protein
MQKGKIDISKLTRNSTEMDYAKVMCSEIYEQIQDLFHSKKEILLRNLEMEYKSEQKIRMVEKDLDSVKEYLQHPFSQILGKKGNADKASDDKNIDTEDAKADLRRAFRFDGIPVKKLKEELMALEISSRERKNLVKLLNSTLTISGDNRSAASSNIYKKADKEFFDAYIEAIIYNHSYRDYFKYLKELYNQYSGKTYGVPKFQWLGSQRDLAELLIELDRNGYLKLDASKVQNFFTPSESINQYFERKGDFIQSENRFTYPKVYKTREGKPEKNKFDKILANTKPTQ